MSAYDIQRRLYFDNISGSVVVMPNFTPFGWFECDFFRITKAGYFYEYEIKLTLSDFKADSKKGDYCWKTQTTKTKYSQIVDSEHKHRPSRFYYVVPEELEEKVAPLIPEWAGLIVNRGHLRTVKQAPILHRKKVSQAIIRQAQKSATGRFWDLHLRLFDLLKIQRLQRTEAA